MPGIIKVKDGFAYADKEGNVEGDIYPTKSEATKGVFKEKINSLPEKIGQALKKQTMPKGKGYKKAVRKPARKTTRKRK